MSTFARRSTSVEATHAKTRSRGLAPDHVDGERCGRAVRLFRDQHGAEFIWNSNTVSVYDDQGHTPGDDHVQRRHWTVVCADRRGAAVR